MIRGAAVDDSSVNRIMKFVRKDVVNYLKGGIRAGLQAVELFAQKLDCSGFRPGIEIAGENLN